MDEETKMVITPKGLMLCGIGGFQNIDMIDKLNDKVVDFLVTFNRAIAVIDGELCFVTIAEEK